MAVQQMPLPTSAKIKASTTSDRTLQHRAARLQRLGVVRHVERQLDCLFHKQQCQALPAKAADCLVRALYNGGRQTRARLVEDQQARGADQRAR